MGKVTWIESPPPDHPIYSGGPEVFSRPEFKPSSTTSTPEDGSLPPELDDPNRPETEEDGIRAEAIKRLGIIRQQEARKRDRQGPTE